ncbi:MAG: glycosyltransferase [Candidatus Omnitrophica bacterium]|nr:glycosyltransferase [Candidatus Omnitrophota bacterium]
MLFSVVVPFLNEEKYIRRCLEALVNQDFDKNEYEIIFVDNGSTDGSSAIVSEHSGVTLLKECGGGAYKARNRGIAAARGDILAFSDADCVVSNGWLSAIFEGMRVQEASITMGPVNFPGEGSAALKLFEDYNSAKLEYTLKYCEPKHYYGNGGNMAIRADVIRKAGPFSERMRRGGDGEMVQRCLAEYEGCKIVYLEDMKVEHLEIGTVGEWLKKIYAYGRWHSPAERGYAYVTLPLGDRFAIYGYCCKKNGYGFWKKTAALFFLGLGMVFIESGRLIRRFKGGDA